MVVDVTVRVGDSSLEEIGVLDGLEGELRFGFLVEQKIHDIGMEARKALRDFLVESKVEVFLIRREKERHENWICGQLCPLS